MKTVRWFLVSLTLTFGFTAVAQDGGDATPSPQTAKQIALELAYSHLEFSDLLDHDSSVTAKVISQDANMYVIQVSTRAFDISTSQPQMCSLIINVTKELGFATVTQPNGTELFCRSTPGVYLPAN